MSDAPRVALVDDHELFRAGVRSELDGLVDVVGDAANVTDAEPFGSRSTCSVCTARPLTSSVSARFETGALL